jgi:hypothetical protein
MGAFSPRSDRLSILTPYNARYHTDKIGKCGGELGSFFGADRGQVLAPNHSY